MSAMKEDDPRMYFVRRYRSVSARTVQRLQVLVAAALMSVIFVDSPASFGETAVADLDPSKVEFFEKNIRPVLAEHCFSCHGEDPDKIRGGLVLNSAAGLLAGGDLGPVVVAGEPAMSRMAEAISYGNEDLRMPPTGKLSDRVIADIVKWIGDGAVDPRSLETDGLPSRDSIYDFSAGRKHWAYQAVVDHLPPPVVDEKWIQQPLDRFVRATHEERGLAPAPQADKRTLIRRATFDLTGLPPTPEEIDAFVKDDSRDAFSKVVDRLLASPRYGERWGRHWLDVARYADSNGFGENVGFPYAYRYRDYVIKAFNDDKPYDRFIHEQLAGDLLPEPESLEAYNDQLVATGFLMVGAKSLGELDFGKREMDIIDEQLDVTAKAFMGETMGCARCHDHKFDPIPTKDYYAMAGIFKSTQIMPARYRFNAYPITRPIGPKADIERHREYEEAVAEAEKGLEDYSAAHEESHRAVWRRDAAKYLLAGTELRDLQEQYISEAEDFVESNLFVDHERFGENIGVVHYINEEYDVPHYVEWEVNADEAGDYMLSLRYAQRNRRIGRRYQKVDLLVNGEVINRSVFKVTTGGRMPENQQWLNQGTFPLKKGLNRIRVQATNARIPPIDQYAVIPVNEGSPSWDRRNDLVDRYAIDPTVLDHWTCYMRNTQRSGDPLFSIWNAFARGHDGPANTIADRILNELEAGEMDASPIMRSVLAGLPPQNLTDLAGRYQTAFTVIDSSPEMARFVRALKEVDDEKDAFDDPDPEQREDSTGVLAIMGLLRGAISPFHFPVDFDAIATEDVRAQLATMRDTLKKLRDNELAPLDMAMVARDWEDENRISDIRVHIRGNHLTKADESVERGFLEVLDHVVDAPKVPGDQSGRLQFAEWLTNPDHPLTARVMVNRIWLHHFGEGIVRSPSNFGLRGEKPSHPELLDYLAKSFIEDGWSIKAMHRRIMLSASYQMSAAYNEGNAAIDAGNVYLWRMNRQRLEVESIRDAMIALAGRLDSTMFGSHPDYDGEERQEPESQDVADFYVSDRRSVYLPVVRSMEYELFKAFDYIDASLDMPKRTATVVAPQALYVMNSPLVMEMAEGFAERLLNMDVSDEQRVRIAFEKAYSRLPNQKELGQALAFIESEEDRLAEHWANLCHVMLASSEFLYIN
jgi:cytochrome c553